VSSSNIPARCRRRPTPTNRTRIARPRAGGTPRRGAPSRRRSSANSLRGCTRPSDRLRARPGATHRRCRRATRRRSRARRRRGAQAAAARVGQCPQRTLTEEETIDHANIVAPLEQQTAKLEADVAAAAGHENMHRAGCSATGKRRLRCYGAAASRAARAARNSSKACGQGTVGVIPSAAKVVFSSADRIGRGSDSPARHS